MADDEKFSSTMANIENKSQEKTTTMPGSLEKIDGTENEITLRWAAPMNKNKTITHYEVKYRAASGKWTPLFTEGEETTISVKNLDNNTEYEFKTRAVYEDNEGPFCKSLKVFTEKQKIDSLDAIDINQAGKPIETSSTDTSISLRWDIPRETEGTIDYYEVRYKESESLRNRWQTIQTSKDENNITVSGLLAQTSYTLKVCAVLDDEEGPYSLCSTISTREACGDQVQMVNDGSPGSNVHVLLEPKTQNEQTSIDCESYDECTEIFHECSESFYECSESDFVDGSEYLSNVKSQEHFDMQMPPPKENTVGIDGIDSKQNPPKTYTNQSDFLSNNPNKQTANEMTDQSLSLRVKDIHVSDPNVSLCIEPSQKKSSEQQESEMTHQSLVLAEGGHVTEPNVSISKDPSADRPNELRANGMNNTGLVPSTEGHTCEPNVTIHKDPSSKKPSQVTAHESQVPSAQGNNSEPYVSIHKTPSSKKPSQLTANEITNQSLVIAWIYPHADEIYEYFEICYRQKKSTKWSRIMSTDNCATITNLLPGTVYEVKVRTVFENGMGNYCDTSTMSTATEEHPSAKGRTSTVKKFQNVPVSKMCAPGKPVAVNVSSTTVSLKWDSTNLNTRDIQYHEICYKECADTKKEWKSYQTHTSANEITITNLRSVTAYEFKVKSILHSAEVTPLSVASDPIHTAAFVIDNIEQTGQSHDSIAISWTRPNNDEDIVNYKIVFKNDSAMEWNTIFTKARENNIVISELSENTEYQVKVIAITSTAQGAESTVLSKFRTGKKPRKNYPQKPQKETLSSRSVTLKWKQCELSRFECYEIRYRECRSPPTKWTAISTRVKLDKFTVTDLKCDTGYEFKVAAVVDGEAGKFSEVSPVIKTNVSLARNIVKTMNNLCVISEGPPKRYKLPVKFKTTDSKGKTRKLELDVEISSEEEKTESNTQRFIKWVKKKVVKKFMVPFNEKTIILVGATGSGKSTLIDGMINYIADVSWDDDFRFSLIDETQDEKRRSKDQTVSQTEWITTYQIPNFPGSPLNYTLNIIDTPGFGDTRGIERDKQIISQIDHLFQTVGENGIETIHGVCFVTQSPLARLTNTVQYIFDSILSVFGKDIAENIYVLITFADGKAPPVIGALTKANVPFKLSFEFNNSALFEPNDASTRDGFAKMFWKMGEESFKRFFDHLETVEPKSLQLTNDVLRTRKTLETIIIGFQIQVVDGMSQLDTIRQEGKILKQHRTDIEANKNFTYTVTDIVIVRKDLEPGQHVTNCITCNMTCHFPCVFPDNEQKKNCAAMKDGSCKVCPMKCSWSNHTNAQFRITSKTVKVNKTYEDLKVKYDVARKEAQNQKVVLVKMKEQFVKIRNDVSEMITQIRMCLNKLDESALKSNPLSSIQYIDLLIHSEEMEMKDGFQGRLTLLRSFRKDAEIIEKAKTGNWEMFDDADQILKEFEINE